MFDKSVLHSKNKVLREYCPRPLKSSTGNKALKQFKRMRGLAHRMQYI